LVLIERNRVLLAAKLFPWSLLWLNPVFYGVRIAAGMVLARAGSGDTRHFPGLRGKIAMAGALLRADFEAAAMLPRMLRKRREIARLRKLSPRQLRKLLWTNRLPLREVA